MQQQQLTKFYDKLLHFLNRTYATNIRTQELYLDLKKHTRKLRFKSIKNIYKTLTEGKADEVIYYKEKSSLIKNSSFNQNYTERICWRLIEKLISKISYYLMNEKKLDCLAPSMLKALHFTRNAPAKVTHKAAFVQFFSEVLDMMIAQNNLLEQKIYQLLIQRGYIQSIDEFYRMSRFQGTAGDFMYSKLKEQFSSDSNAQQALSVYTETVKTNERPNKIKSRNRMVSIRKFVHSKNQSKLGSFSLEVDEFSGLPQVEQKIKQVESQTDSEEQSVSEVQDKFKYNKIVHNIHNQVEKMVDQIMNHKDFNKMLAISDNSKFSILKSQERLDPKQQFLRQVLKNLKIKNFEANEQLIAINTTSHRKIQPQRKNSRKPKDRKQFTTRENKALKNENHRISMATVISSRLREKVMKSSGIQQIKQLIVRNLGNLQNKCDENQENKAAKQKKVKRLRTQTFQAKLQRNTSERRCSNLNFLRSAFVFNPDSKSGLHQQYLNELKNQKFEDLFYQSQISSQNAQNTLKSIGSYKSKQQQPNRVSSQNIKQLFTNDRIAKLSRFGSKNRWGHAIQSKNFNKTAKNNFNPVLLQLAAKKYHRCLTQESNLKSLQEFVYDHQTEKAVKNIQTLQKDQKATLNKKPYIHHRRNQTFDRLHRRIF